MKAQVELKQLRNWRVWQDRDTTIAASLREATARIDEQRRASAGAGESWEALVPPRLRQRCTILLHRGSLTVRARDAAARFEIDRWLRAGGEAALTRRAGIRKVKIV